MTGVAMSTSIPARCAIRGLAIGRAIRDTVHAMPIGERGRADTAALKPGGVRTQHVDRVAEEVGIAALEQLAGELGHRVVLIADVAAAALLPLGSAAAAEVIFAHLDAVDGTIKVGGLGSDLAAGRARVANDGSWGVAMAFSAPTRKSLAS